MDILNKSIHTLPPSSLPLMNIQYKIYQEQLVHMTSNQQIRRSENIHVISKLVILSVFFFVQTLHTNQNNLEFLMCNCL